MNESQRHLDTARILVVGSAEWLERFAETVSARTDASVHTVATATEALDGVHGGRVDCLVTAYTLGETTGIDLVERLRESTPTLPVVLGATDGSEAVASRAIQAGVTDYVPVTEPLEGFLDDLLDRTEQAIRSARREATRRKQANQFNAVFHDTQTATWVLDPDGTLARVNQTARELIDGDAGSPIGDLFWTLPWWEQADSVERDVRRLVERAQDGRFGNAVVSQPSTAATQHVLDLSIRPVENESGDLVSIVVEGIDITEQVALERDLRESERLHRVTLNNMTDTVLMTDESGDYTYVCPNVHFIFGYTADEIYDQGGIDALLGENLFDREELAANGVLKNIECTVTDKAGREHTLLVNVREVSIQGGTLLYSCRDITKRKRREEALATLQRTAREFLYAETRQEIAQQMTSDVSSVLDLGAGAVYLFDVDENELRPAAHSPTMTNLHGPLPAVHVDSDGLPSHSFVTDETLLFDDVHGTERLENRATDLRSAIYIPLGNHGVFVAGSDDVGAFDDATQELADLLAATAEAALDRVTREAQLREQDRELKRQNEQLTALNRINTTIREIDQAVVRAETREEIDHAVCERLTDTARFKFAWIGTTDPDTGTVDPLVWAGDEQGYLDSHPISVAASETEPAGRTAATGEVTSVPNVAADLRDEPWRSNALTRDFISVVSIPLMYNDFTHGILTIYADTRDAFDDTTRTVLTELGETIASALSAVERKQALLTTSTTRVEWTVDDPTFLLSELAQRGGCTLSYRGGVQQTTRGNYVFVTVEDADVSAVGTVASNLAGVDDVTQISGGVDGGVLRLQIAQPFLAVELADHGAIFREATADPATTTLVVDIPESADSRKITQLVRDTFSSVELKRKTHRQNANRDINSQFVERVTDRQLEVVQTAYYSGFFESPRENTGKEIAETLEISPPAFYQHVRTVQRKLFSALFEDDSLEQPGSEEV
jgi:PAS domain S-box-containing protein